MYNGLAQLTGQYQADEGAVNTSTTPEVQYTYTNPSAGSEVASMAYPNSVQQNITSISSSGTTATVTYTGATEFVTGEKIQISSATTTQYDGTFIINTLNSGSSTFTITLTGSYSGSDSNSGIVADSVPRILDYAYGVQEPIASITASGTTATATYSGASQFSSGAQIIISGAADSQFDGTFTIASINTSSSTFTFSLGASVTANDFSSDITAVEPSADPLDLAIGRTASIQDQSGSGAGALETYSYLGLSTLVSQDLSQPGIDLSYLQQSGDTLAGGNGGDQYTGLDQFGRVIDQNWVGSSGSVDRFQYGYDADGNVLYKNDIVDSFLSQLYHANSTTAGDNSTAYDPLGRITTFSEGVLSSSGNNGSSLDTIATPSTTQTWGLDALGNWASSTSDGGSTSGTDDSQNEETAITPGFGTLDTTFGTGGIATSSLDNVGAGDAIAIVPSGLSNSGDILVTGITSGDHIYVAEYNTDGTLNTSFGTAGIVVVSSGSSEEAYAISALSDGTILVSGHVTISREGVQIELIKLNADGSLDTAFGTGGIVNTQIGAYAEARSMAVLSTGKILVGGQGTDTGGHEDVCLVEYNGDGSLDTAFGSGGIVLKQIGAYSEAYSMAVTTGGTILVGGWGTDTGGHQEMVLAEFNGDGSMDTSFGSGGIVVHEIGAYTGIDAIHVDSDGTILAAGYGTNGSGDLEMALVKVSSTGSLETAFGLSGVDALALGDYSAANALVVDSDGTILVGGLETDTSGDKEIAIIAYNGDGSLDTTFGNGAITTEIGSSATANAMTIDPNGELDVAGLGDTDELALVRYNATNTASSQALTYDNNGNTLTDENGMTYTYDAWNRMVTATPAGSTYHEEYYTYNALGERVTDLDGVQSGIGPVLVINDGNEQRSMIDSLTVIFPQAVTLSSGALELSESGVGDLTISWTNPSGDGKTWVISLASVSGLAYGSLPNGQYTLTIHHADVSGYSMSSDQTYNFHRLFGDFYDEGRDGADDVALMNAHWVSSSSPLYLWYADGNDDGSMTFADLLELAQDEGTTYTDTAAGPIYVGASTTEGAGSGEILAGLSPREFYYSSQWQLIQETANNPGTGGMQTAEQYVWGIAYENELILRDSDSDESSSTGSYGIIGSGLDQCLYALQDANYNVTALVGLVSGTWEVVERFEYTPYGTMTVLNASGAQTTDSFNWLYGFQGGRRDPVTGLINFQNRNYDPTTGTWMTQDPAGYVNGANLYQFVRANPESFLDPRGLDSQIFLPGGGYFMGIPVPYEAPITYYPPPAPAAPKKCGPSLSCYIKIAQATASLMIANADLAAMLVTAFGVDEIAPLTLVGEIATLVGSISSAAEAIQAASAACGSSDDANIQKEVKDLGKELKDVNSKYQKLIKIGQTIEKVLP